MGSKIDTGDFFFQRRSQNLRSQQYAHAVWQHHGGIVKQLSEGGVAHGLIHDFGVGRHTVGGPAFCQDHLGLLQRFVHGDIVELDAHHINFHREYLQILRYIQRYHTIEPSVCPWSQ